MGFIDYIFPKRCVICKKPGSYLCENCFIFLSFDVKMLCPVCKKFSLNNLTHKNCLRKYSIDGCFSALAYNKTTQKLINSFKSKPYLLDLKSVLVDLFYESIIQNEQFQKEIEGEKWIMIPIPLSATKFRKRGYNQAEILARELEKKLNIPVENLLQKKTLSIKNKNVFLVDDLTKTGRTLSNATKILKKAGAKRVFGLTLARN